MVTAMVGVVVVLVFAALVVARAPPLFTKRLSSAFDLEQAVAEVLFHLT